MSWFCHSQWSQALGLKSETFSHKSTLKVIMKRDPSFQNEDFSFKRKKIWVLLCGNFFQTFSCLVSCNVVLMAGKYRISPRRPQQCTLAVYTWQNPSLAVWPQTNYFLLRLGFFVIKTDTSRPKVIMESKLVKGGLSVPS